MLVDAGVGDETVEGSITIDVTGGRLVAASVAVGVKVTCGLWLVGTTGGEGKTEDGGWDEGVGLALSEVDSVDEEEAGPVVT